MTRTTLENPDRSPEAALPEARRHGLLPTRVALAAAFLCWLPLGLAESQDKSESQARSEVELRKRLHDAKPAARLQAALELVSKGAAEAVPILIDLLVEVPAAQRQPIEEALRELAGAWAPNVTLAGDDDLARGIRRDAWAAWWRRTDGPALLGEFRKRTLSPTDQEKARALIRKLNDKTFSVRDQAETELIAYGAPVVPLLREASNGTDLEQRRRAERCMRTIATCDRPLPPVAARMLALRKPEGASAALLDFLPWTEDEALAAEAQKALRTLAVRDSKADPALVRALSDPLALRRAVAAEVLADVGDARLLAEVRKLLTDANREVRLCVALALVRARDRAGVPVLIDLVADLPRGHAWEAEVLLRTLAGGNAPAVSPKDDAPARRKYRAAWLAWWQQHGATVNLAELKAAPTRTAAVSARASNHWEGFTPDKAFAGGSLWNSGGYAPQWLEADLGAPARLAGVLLTVTQVPAGGTTHEVWVSDEPIGDNLARAKLVHTFAGNTDDGQQLKVDFPRDLVARYVQVRTTQSPSWVAWAKVELRLGRTRFGFPAK